MKYISLLLLIIMAATGCKEDPLPPTATPYVRTSTTISSLTRTSAVSGGTVINDYGAAITEKGVCWSLATSTPTYNSSTKTSNGEGSGSYSSQITGLTQNRAYRVRSYAINANGISYGQTISFTTPN